MSVLKIKDQNGNWIEIPAGGDGVPSGGTPGQVLKKTNGGTGWFDDIPIYIVSSPPTSSNEDGLYFVTS